MAVETVYRNEGRAEGIRINGGLTNYHVPVLRTKKDRMNTNVLPRLSVVPCGDLAKLIIPSVETKRDR